LWKTCQEKFAVEPQNIQHVVPKAPTHSGACAEQHNSICPPSANVQHPLSGFHALQALKDERALDEISGEYHKRFGRYPASTKDLLDAKMIAGIPVDPAGIPYAIGPDGKSRLDPKSPVLIEIPPKDPGERRPS
jgi:hypothetical protein